MTVDLNTDQYSLCEAGAIALLRTLSQFSKHDYQVSDDDSVITKGAEYYAIFQPDAFPNTRANGLQAFYNWVVIFDVYVRYSTRKESLPKFKALRAALINLFSPISLNHIRGVTTTVLSANGGLMQDLPGDNPTFIIQTMSLTITQLVTRIK
jgi:hypothetical protein